MGDKKRLRLIEYWLESNINSGFIPPNLVKRGINKNDRDKIKRESGTPINEPFNMKVFKGI